MRDRVVRLTLCDYRALLFDFKNDGKPLGLATKQFSPDQAYARGIDAL